MRLSPLQRQEPAEAADIGGRQGQVRVATAQFGRQEVQGEVMAANGDNGTVEALGRAQQLNRHLLASIEALGEARYDNQAVGSYERHDDSGAALDGRRHPLRTYATQPDAQVFVLACRRQHLW